MKNEAKTRHDFAVRILAAWRRSVEAIFEVGDLLNEAKDTLPYGTFSAMVTDELQCSLDTAEKYMRLARNEHLRESEIVRILPPSYSTIFELSRLSPEAFGAAVAAGRITRQMTRADAEAIRHHRVTRVKIEHTEGPAEADTAGQDMPDTDLEDFGGEEDEDDAPPPPASQTMPLVQAYSTENTSQPAVQTMPFGRANPTEDRLLAAQLAMRDVCTIVRVRADEASSRSLDDCEAAHKRLGKWIEWFRNGDGSYFNG